MSEPIIVWAFDDAPPELQALSEHGGDEDWIAELPPFYVDAYVPWIDSGAGFGSCEVSSHAHPTKPGHQVRIGAHA